MSTKVQLRREAAAFLATYVGAPGELLVDTTNNRVLVQDGATPGGFAQAKLSDLGGRNLLINGNFAINQRGYVSGAALTANAYGHDRWRDGGAGGFTYTFNQGTPDTTITVTAGRGSQSIEPANVAGGTYVLSWVGTTGMAVYYTNGSGQAASVIGASPLVAPNVGPGCTIYVETSGTGTLGLVQFEAETVPTLFGRRQIGVELALCQRYYRLFPASLGAWAANSATTFTMAGAWPDMRASPTVALVSPGSGVLDPNFGVYPVSAIAASSISSKYCILTFTTAAASALHQGVLLGDVIVSLSAEL